MDAAPIPVETLLEHREWVRAVARAVVRDPNAADDVEQDAWVAALSSPPRHESSLRGWFGAVVRSRARRTGRTDARRGRRETVAARADVDASAADLAEIADTHRRVVQAVVELAEPYRQTILLRYFEGLAVEDVAAKTNAPLNTARARISRGLATLRERLARELGDGERPWELALVPLIGGRRGTAAGAGIGAAAVGGTAMATKAGWIAAGALLVAGLGAIVASKWPASADESKAVALAAAPVPAPAPPAADDGAKPPAPKAAEPAPKPAQDKPAAPAETAKQKLDRVKVTAGWDNTPLLEILGDLSAQTDVDFFIAAEALDPTAKNSSQTLQMDNVPAGTLVEVLAGMAGLSVAVEDARVVVLPGDGKRDESKALVVIPRSVPGAKKTFTVKGVVVDEQGAPVAHASVMSTGDQTKVFAQSGADGTFSFEAGRSFGRAFAGIEGRVPSWAFAVDGKYGDTVEVKLALRGRASAVEGVVTDADGRECAGAVVQVVPADPAAGATPPKGASVPLPPAMTTGADGRFAARTLPAGDFEIIVRPKVGATIRVKGTAKPEETVHVDVRLPVVVTWRGTLRDAGGKPVAGAMINVGARLPARTGADGSFEIGGVEPGRASVRISTAQGARYAKTVTIEAGAEFRADLVVGAGARIAGRVVDETGAPLPKCIVELLPTAPWMPRTHDTIESGADGTFEFAGIEAGSYRLAVSRGSAVPVRVTDAVATDTGDVEVKAPGGALATVRARLVDADGKPASPANLFARDVVTGFVAQASTDGIGALRIERLPRGRYFLWTATSNWSVTEFGARDVAAGADVDLGKLQAERSHGVTLRAEVAGDAVTTPVRLALRRVLGDGASASLVTVTLRSVPYDSAQSLTAGRYVVTATGDAIQTAERTFDVGATGDTTVALRLRPAPARRIALEFPGDTPPRARLRVLDADGLAGESVFAGTEASLRLVPGSYRVETDVPDGRVLTGTLVVPAEGAPDVFDVPLR